MSRIGRYLLCEEVFWPVSAAVMTRIGRYLPYGVAVLGRVAGRDESYRPLCVVRRGCSGPYRWPL